MARTKKNGNGQKHAGSLIDDKVAVAYQIRFTSPLLMHKFSQKAVEEMLKKQMGLPVEQEPKVPAECIKQATMINEKGQVCVLPVAFKKSILSGAAGLKAAKSLKLRSQLWVMGQSVPIEYDEKIDRMDMVMVGPWNNRVADVRFRPQFNGARCTIVIKAPEKIPQEMIVELINLGGEIGVGEWRPSKSGNLGTYEIDKVVVTSAGVNAALEACSSPVPPLVIPEWAMNAEISPTILARIMAEQQPGADND